jgi:pyruvate,water dikinase
VGEDSAEATFAGQQETYLWVRGADGVCDAVRDCWASLYSPEAISYRARIGDAGRAPAMGVTVQLMVDAEVSGVMFTCNPVTGDPSSLAVNASWGLGLAVVGGEVTPDEFRVSKVTGEVLQRTVGPKAVEYLPDPAGGGTIRAEVAPERQGVACLEDAQLAALLDVGRRVERHFDGHQDVEWAIDRDGELHLLQSRPVTAAPAKAAAPPGPRSAIDLVMGTFGVRKET